jgi:hypothetical protein
MILRGDTNKFKNIMEEALTDRATTIMESLYKEQSKAIVNEIKTEILPPVPVTKSVTSEISPICEVYVTKDGKTISLTKEQVESVTKLYKNLNNSNKERLLKLLSESEDSINRIIKLAKFERNKNVK